MKQEVLVKIFDITKQQYLDIHGFKGVLIAAEVKKLQNDIIANLNKQLELEFKHLSAREFRCTPRCSVLFGIFW